MPVDYTIEPVKNREVIQKNFIRLGEKAGNYSGRHPSLNERFAILERGYYLAPKLEFASNWENVKPVELYDKESRDEFIQKLKDKTAAKSVTPSPSHSPRESLSP